MSKHESTKIAPLEIGWKWQKLFFHDINEEAFFANNI